MTPELQRRSWPGRFLRMVVDPWVNWVFWRLNLDDGHGHPDHNKVMSSIAFFFGLVGLALFGTVVVRSCDAVERLVFLIGKNAISIGAGELGVLLKSCSVMTAALLAYAALVFGMAFGLSGFRTWAKTRGGGTAEALAQIGAAASFDSLAAAALAAATPEGRERADLV